MQKIEQHLYETDHGGDIWMLILALVLIAAIVIIIFNRNKD